VQLILASASPARLGVLRNAGIEPVVRVSGVDEDAVTASLSDPKPAELVAALARAKAEAVVQTVAATHPDAVVVGCDSMLEIDGDVVGKPGTVDVALRRWSRMGGGTGVLLTGHAVVRLTGGAVTGEVSDTESTTIQFSRPSQREMEAYVATGEPLAVAGGFTIDGLGGWFVDAVDGNPSSVIGISLPLTRRLLGAVGVSVVDLWRDGGRNREEPDPTGQA
jgi:septum formation protein